MHYVVMATVAAVAFLGAASDTGSSSFEKTLARREIHGWLTATQTPSCAVKREWAQDFHGKPYLRKQRVCV